MNTRHILVATSETNDVKTTKYRIVKHDLLSDLSSFCTELLWEGGVWHISQTVNARDASKAKQSLINEMMSESFDGNVEDAWTNILLNDSYKAQNNCLVTLHFAADMDPETKRTLMVEFNDVIGCYRIKTSRLSNTVQFICSPFDKKIITNHPKFREMVTINDDGQFLLKIYDTNQYRVEDIMR